RFGEEKLARGKFYGGTWQDKLRVDWEMHDRELSRVFADKVDEDMKKTGGRNIILMTHVVTHRRYAVPCPTVFLTTSMHLSALRILTHSIKNIPSDTASWDMSISGINSYRMISPIYVHASATRANGGRTISKRRYRILCRCWKYDCTIKTVCGTNQHTVFIPSGL